ncbi:YobI family P-loop NTPase, partial [Providencia stuartii]|uniref:YobI family P-loop NTPase n=1 Tax=Providencia stuartii TaxID=588 RepID=UPI003F8239C9
IVPIIPIVDGSNSYELLDKLFDKSIEDRAFLRGVSLYIDDYRVLKNIYNEYVVYFEKLKIIGLNANKMLAIVTYKNLFPNDFSQLQLGRGYVYNVLNFKHEIISNNKEEIESKIGDLEKRISDVDDEFLKSSSELENLNEYFILKKDTKRRNEYGYDKFYNEINEEQKLFLKSYEKRVLVLKDKANKKNLLRELDKTKFELIKIENQKISDLITNKNVEWVFKQNSVVNGFEGILNNDYFSLLVYLIRGGYIDESYKDYMAIVHENSLSRKDRIFIHSVMDRKGENNDLELDNPNNILGLLTEDMFYQEEILNFTLIKFMMKNSSKNERMLSALILQLKENEKLKFVFDFWFVNEKDKNINVVFARLLAKYWSSVLIELINNKTFENDINDYYDLTKIFLEGCHIDNLPLVNESNKLSNYISKCSDYLRKSNYKTNGLVDKLKLINVKFITIDSNLSDFNLLEQVYQKSTYEINLNNLYLMVDSFYYSEMNLIKYDRFIKCSYSTIKSMSDS